MYGYRYKPGSKVFELHETMTEQQAIELVQGKRAQQQVRANSRDAATVELLRMGTCGHWLPVPLPPVKKPGKGRSDQDTNAWRVARFQGKKR
jgi:hypothetical protein